MSDYAKIYYFYNLLLIKILRISVFITLILIMIFFTINALPFGIFPSVASLFSAFLLSFFLIFEFFFHFKISRLSPFVNIQKNDGRNYFDSFTLPALSIFTSTNDLKQIIKLLLSKKEIQFILDKAGFKEEEITLLHISKDNLASFAFNLAKTVNGKAVTTIDLFAAYILFTEEQAKLLFNKNLKKDEFTQILLWARKAFPEEENHPPIKVSFWGQGIGEDWVFGWTIETKKYMLDLTSRILQEKPLVIGREKEYRLMLEILYKNKSIILIGEPGSGKTTLADTLAFNSFLGELEGNFSHQRFHQLLIDRLLAGASNQGELESRLDNVIAEVSHSGNLIIFIPDIENIFGASTFNINLAGTLIPYLKQGNFRIIGTTSPGAYKKYIEPMKSLTDIFGIVKLENPDKDTSLQMLFEKAPEIERKNNVYITYRAIIAAFNFAEKYLQGRVMPGAGAALLEDTVSTVKYLKRNLVEEQDIIAKIESKTKIAIGIPKTKEKEMLLHLEDEIHKRIINQEKAVSAISEGMRRIRTGLESSTKPVSFLFLGPTGVGKTETAKTLASIYFGDESKMIRVDMSEYSTNEGVKRLLGGLPDEEGLTDKIYEHPFSLILLDEFEKAAPLIRNLFLQVLDDGRLTDNKGRTVSFIDTIIIATSNAASEYIREEVGKGRAVDKMFQKDLLEFLQRNNIFKPELLNRFDEVVVFKPLGVKEATEVTKLILNELSKKLLERYITVKFDDKLVAKIVKEGISDEFGARPLRRFAQDNIEDQIAQKMLKDELKKGDIVTLSTDNSNTITIDVA